MSNEVVEMTQQPQQNQPDPNAKNVINYMPAFPVLLARVMLDLPVQEMASDFVQMAVDTVNYDGGFTTYYNNQNIDHVRGVKELKEAIYGVASSYIKEMKWGLIDLNKCAMQIWVNVMREKGFHGIHNHGRSVLSGTYYVQTTDESAPLVIENPLQVYRMHEPHPERPEDFTEYNSPSIVLQSKPNTLLLWPSWLFHHVPANQKLDVPRISVSFNLDYLPKGA